MKKFNTGDKVTSYQYGHGVVFNGSYVNGAIVVKFCNENDTTRQYTQDGRYHWQDKTQDLFHGHVELQVTVKEIPQYEYKFLYTDLSNNEVYLTSHYYVSPNELFDIIPPSKIKNVILVEESKRERKST